MLMDKALIEDDMAKNWGWLLASGVIDVALGVWAYATPVSSTLATELTYASALSFLGVLNVAGLFFSDYKVRSLLLGITQLSLSYLLFNYPLSGAISITSFLAYSVMADGLYRILLAVQNEDLPQRGWTGLGGAVSLGWGLYVLNYLPLTSLTTLGSALGVFLVSTGATRISAGFAGRELANQK